MTVKEIQDQLRLAKNKDANVLFKYNDKIVDAKLLAEVVRDGKGVRYPKLGETADTVVVVLDASEEEKVSE